jgi:hypothetical protein
LILYFNLILIIFIFIYIFIYYLAILLNNYLYNKMSYSNTKAPHSKSTSYINLNWFNYASDPVESLNAVINTNCIIIFYTQGKLSH